MGRVAGACASLVLGFVGACLFQQGGGDAPAGSVQIGDSDNYILSAVAVDTPMPGPSSDPAAPVITAAEWKNTGSDSFVMIVTVQSEYAIGKMHIEIDGQHYVVTLEDGTKTIDACAILAGQGGYGCTAKCLDACGCVKCDTDQMQTNLEGACAVNCSILVQQGGLSAAPYNGSEVLYADVVYNGYSDPSVGQIDGMIASAPGCTADACASAAAPLKVVEFGFVSTDYTFLEDLPVGGLVAETQPAPEKPMMTSPSYPGGSINGCPSTCCGPGVC